SRPNTLSASKVVLQDIANAAGERRSSMGDQADQEIVWWTRGFESQCRSHLDDLTLLAPWTDLHQWTERAERFPSDDQTKREASLGDIVRRMDSISTLRETTRLESELLSEI